jgi:mono/diheme cytochrome c family protein
MKLRIRIICFAISAMGVLAAQETATIKKVPLAPTSPVSGGEMFDNYCASCHGKDGIGNGPVTVALKHSPANLTTLTARNDGKFPELRVSQAIMGDFQIAAHGSREMPVWGSLLGSLDNRSPAMVRLRVQNLTDFVRTLQRK